MPLRYGNWLNGIPVLDQRGDGHWWETLLTLVTVDGQQRRIC